MKAKNFLSWARRVVRTAHALSAGVCALVFAACAVAAPGQPGTLDATFGANGAVTSVDPFNVDSGAAAIAIQSDGKIVLAGYCYNFNFPTSNSDFCVVRRNADGTADGSFGNQYGVVITPVGTGFEGASAVAIQPDGKIVLAGSDMCAVRLQTSGVLDTTFGDAGVFSSGSFGIVGYNRAKAIFVEPSGSIILAGECNNGDSTVTDFCFYRVSAAGALVNQRRSLSVMTAGKGAAAAAAMQPDGKLLIAGTCTQLSGSQLVTKDFCIVRFNANGTLDTSFNDDGLVVGLMNSLAADDRALAMVLQPNGKIVIAARCTVFSVGKVFCVDRHNTDGSRDTSFGSNGRSTANALTAATLDDRVVYAAALQPDGRLILAGECKSNSGVREFCMQRYDADCSLDMDASNSFNAAVDGSILVRSMFGFSGNALTSGLTASPGAARTVSQAASYRSYCAAAAAPLCNGDIDGDGKQTATIDGLLAIRAMLGLTFGSTLTNGIRFPSNATRTNSQDIGAYLNAQCGMKIPLL